MARATMVGEVLDPQTLDHAVRALLEPHRAAIVVAMDNAVRTSLPDDELFAGRPTLPIDGGGESAVDFALPADRMIVVDTWERAVRIGLAQGRIRLAGDPDLPLTLTVVDARHRYGVWLEVLIPDEGWDAARSPAVHSEALAVRRPRTGVLHKNLFGVITDVDDRALRMLGFERSDLVRHRSLEFIHPDDHERAIGQWLEMRARRMSQRVRVRHRHRDGSWLWIEVENQFVGLDDPDKLVAIARLTDISDEMTAHEAVQQREKLFRRLAESLPVGVFQVAADQRIVYANARLSTLLGVQDAATLTEQIDTVAAPDRPALEEALEKALAAGTDRELEVDVVLRGRPERRRCLFTVAALSGEEGMPGAIVSVTDVTDGARLREQLRVQATHDSLTGCLNRAATLAALERSLGTAGADEVVVIFVDLDRFKAVNDTHGHAVGDQLLTVAARRIAAQARKRDVVGRIGGDEFLLVCRGVTDQAQASDLARRVHHRLRGRVHVAGRQVPLAASVGVTMAWPGATADALVARADAAMYESKRRGGHSPVLFHP